MVRLALRTTNGRSPYAEFLLSMLAAAMTTLASCDSGHGTTCMADTTKKCHQDNTWHMVYPKKRTGHKRRCMHLHAHGSSGNTMSKFIRIFSLRDVSTKSSGFTCRCIAVVQRLGFGPSMLRHSLSRQFLPRVHTHIMQHKRAPPRTGSCITKQGCVPHEGAYLCRQKVIELRRKKQNHDDPGSDGHCNTQPQARRYAHTQGTQVRKPSPSPVRGNRAPTRT